MINSKIIKLASNTKYVGLKDVFTHKSTMKNSFCGDLIKIEVIVNNKKIKLMRYETESCVLCEASASLLANKIKNLDLNEFKENIKIFKKIKKGNEISIPSKFKEYKYLLNKRTFNRINCVILPIEALLKAFKIRL